jgi:dihydroorotate dehydrogenase (NAD+) catalytic subunit
MLTLPNGKKIDFLCASGALGFTGHGYWWEQPFFWMKWIRPEELTIISKTLTSKPCQGKYRWWNPLRTFRLISGGTVNNLGLPNPGYKQWIESYYPKTCGLSVIVSIAPDSVAEAKEMAGALASLRGLVAVEINLSCPNVSTPHLDELVAIAETVAAHSGHPTIAKLGVPYLDLCRALDRKVDAFDLINSVAWSYVFPGRLSPLGRSIGAVSGTPIKELAREALRRVIPICRTPVITGGGIDSLEEVRLRAVMGARAFTFGTIFLRHPSWPNRIAKDWREGRRL